MGHAANLPLSKGCARMCRYARRRLGTGRDFFIIFISLQQIQCEIAAVLLSMLLFSDSCSCFLPCLLLLLCEWYKEGFLCLSQIPSRCFL